MGQSIRQDLEDIKAILERIVGLADKSVTEPFSEKALDKIAQQFLELSVNRGDWVKDSDIRKYIKHAPWHNPGGLLRSEFAFTNYWKKGHEYYYSRKDLIALAEELTKRNINLERYRELVDDKAAFDRSMAKGKFKDKPYQVPIGLQDIETCEIPKPDPELVRQDLARLKVAFKAAGHAAYIDIYKGNHAMVKSMYIYQKYLEPGLKKTCERWCEDFNYANRALEAITGKKEKFKPPPDPTQIQL